MKLAKISLYCILKWVIYVIAYYILTSNWYIPGYLSILSQDYEEDLSLSCSSIYKEIDGIFSAF